MSCGCQLLQHKRIVLLHVSYGILWRWSHLHRYQGFSIILILFWLFLYEIARTQSLYYHEHFSSQPSYFSVDFRNEKAGGITFMGCNILWTSNSGHSYVFFYLKISTNVTQLDYHLSISSWLIFAMMMLTVPTQKDLTTAHAWKDTLEMESPAKVNYTLSL